MAVLFLPSCAQAETGDGEVVEEVIFPNPHLAAAVRAAIDKPYEEPIYTSDLKELTSLDADHRDITDISGLEHCTNLTELDLSGNEISDISPLASLSNLTELDLSGNRKIDISSLASLNNLTTLDLSLNQISNISPLASLNNLTELDLPWNEISDISPLASINNLTELDLSHNPLSTTSVDVHVPQLRQRGVYVIGVAESNEMPGFFTVLGISILAALLIITIILKSMGRGTGDALETVFWSSWIPAGLCYYFFIAIMLDLPLPSFLSGENAIIAVILAIPLLLITPCIFIGQVILAFLVFIKRTRGEVEKSDDGTVINHKRY